MKNLYFLIETADQRKEGRKKERRKERNGKNTEKVRFSHSSRFVKL
jgi:uncharacterized protein YkuJ